MLPCEAIAHVGPRAFAEVTGEKVNTAAFVLRREQLAMERRRAQGVYFRLVKEPDAESKQTAFEQALARFVLCNPILGFTNTAKPTSRRFQVALGSTG